MAILTYVAALAALAPLAQSHYSFVRLKANGAWHAPLQYIRNMTSPLDEKQLVDSNMIWREWNWPTYFVDWPTSVRCGRGNMDHANATEVLTITAGEEIEIAHQRSPPVEWTDDMFYECADDRGTCQHRPGYKQDFNHPGPLLIHLSKVPDGQDIHSYDGSGEWVKIHSRGLVNAIARPIKWELYTDVPPHLTFRIPKQTPPGQYLMRMDVLWPGLVSEFIKIGTPGSLGQMYPTCAQLNVVSTSTDTLPGGVKIPEVFSPYAPGMTQSKPMYNLEALDEGYIYPGGPLWDGEKLVEDNPLLPHILT